ncbi:MAG: hypothetical protein KDA71_16125 [Planctomycetales bacterium]|nr:hypothetical protein [Planctomycetales bacterium]
MADEFLIGGFLKHAKGDFNSNIGKSSFRDDQTNDGYAAQVLELTTAFAELDCIDNLNHGPGWAYFFNAGDEDTAGKVLLAKGPSSSEEIFAEVPPQVGYPFKCYDDGGKYWAKASGGDNTAILLATIFEI